MCMHRHFRPSKFSFGDTLGPKRTLTITLTLTPNPNPKVESDIDVRGDRRDSDSDSRDWLSDNNDWLGIITHLHLSSHNAQSHVVTTTRRAVNFAVIFCLQLP